MVELEDEHMEDLRVVRDVRQSQFMSKDACSCEDKDMLQRLQEL